MLDPLRYFVLVHELGTITAASKAAHVTQPALTTSLQRLERDLGAKLFERGAAGARLTRAGDALLPSARAALAALEDGRRAVTELVGLERGVVRLGAGATICTYFLPPIIARFRDRYPKIRISLREAVTDDVGVAVERGDLDLGIIARIREATEESRSATTEPWFEDQLVLVTSREGPYRPAKLDVARAPFVTFPKGATTRELLDEAFPGAEIAMELGGIAAIKNNVRAGIGIALVSKRALVRDLRARSLVVVKHPKTPLRRRFSLVHRGEDRLPPAARALYQMLRDAAR